MSATSSATAEAPAALPNAMPVPAAAAAPEQAPVKYANSSWLVCLHYYFVKHLNPNDYPKFLQAWNNEHASKMPPIDKEGLVVLEKKNPHFKAEQIMKEGVNKEAVALNKQNHIQREPLLITIFQRIFSNFTEDADGILKLKASGDKTDFHPQKLLLIIYNIAKSIFTNQQVSVDIGTVRKFEDYTFIVIYSPLHFDILDFRAREELGRGNFGRVSKLLSLVQGVYRAYKEPSPPLYRNVTNATDKFYNDAEQEKYNLGLRGLRREIVALKAVNEALQHPSIQPNFEWVIDSDNVNVHCTISNVYGPNLLKFLRAHPNAPKATLIKYCTEALNIIILLANNNIVHGDFKPDNIVRRTVQCQQLILIDWSHGLVTNKMIKPCKFKPYAIEKSQADAKEKGQKAYADFPSFLTYMRKSGHEPQPNETPEERLARKLQYDLYRLGTAFFEILTNGEQSSSDMRERLATVCIQPVVELCEAMFLGTMDVHQVSQAWHMLIDSVPIEELFIQPAATTAAK